MHVSIWLLKFSDPQNVPLVLTDTRVVSLKPPRVYLVMMKPSRTPVCSRVCDVQFSFCLLHDDALYNIRVVLRDLEVYTNAHTVHGRQNTAMQAHALKQTHLMMSFV